MKVPTNFLHCVSHEIPSDLSIRYRKPSVNSLRQWEKEFLHWPRFSHDHVIRICSYRTPTHCYLTMSITGGRGARFRLTSKDPIKTESITYCIHSTVTVFPTLSILDYAVELVEWIGHIYIHIYILYINIYILYTYNSYQTRYFSLHHGKTLITIWTKVFVGALKKNDYRCHVCYFIH